ncbi:MAG TPA: sulfite exporter TauE/SafE family protein, partial [Chthoniobacterales bacterium]
MSSLDLAIASANLSAREVLLLVVAGVLAGIMNAVAGGGTFLTFPALVFTGIPPIAANQTSTIAVFPGQVASFWAYRNILAAEKRAILVLGLTSLIGGSTGAVILLHMSSSSFDQLV